MAEPKLIDSDDKHSDVDREEDSHSEREERSQSEDKPEIERSDSGEVVVKPSRADRRSERGFKRRLEAETKARDEEIARMRMELAEMRGAVGAMRTQPAQQPMQQQAPQNKLRSRLEKIWSQQETIQGMLSKSQDPSEIKRLKDQWYDLETEKTEVTHGHLREQLQAQQQQQNQGNARREDPRVAAEMVILSSEFPEIFKDTNALAIASSTYQRIKSIALHRGENVNDTMRLQRQALAETAEILGMSSNGSGSNSDAVRARYGGLPSQAGAQRASHGEVRLTKEQQAMAYSMYPHLPENVALSRWADLWRKNQEPKD